MEFEATHARWIDAHLAQRTGERKGRLERGHQHGETLFLRNVWWPLVGNFDQLHPEYEVLDWRGRSYFADFAWLPGHVKMIWEIKGYGPHVRDMDRKKYCNELNREIFLQSLGFRVVSFAYDDVNQRPELCITLLRMLLSRYQPRHAPVQMESVIQKEIILLAFSLARPLRPIDVQTHLSINHRTAVRHLQSLCAVGWFKPLNRQGTRVRQYVLTRSAIDHFEW
ncbi:hypothetical protein [Paenibacillus faecalis]|uniref:hypothetical protein n=1 Tax=Paenibacillus faecalis TaxID=2079532 RepID=UPI000D0F9987|nr:hypothetical protein [Paenibacillus faecalis]